MEEWSERMACWWEATPFRGAVQACAAEVEEHLDSLFQAAKGGANARSAIVTHGVSHGCEWVPKLVDRLQLPAFPELGGMPSLPLDFHLPKELLPWGVQKW